MLRFQLGQKIFLHKIQIILSCNVRGANRKGLRHQIKEHIMEHKPDIIVLMETKINSIRAKGTNHLKFQFH